MPDVTDPIALWELKTAELKQLKKDEHELRKQIIAIHFPEMLTEGTHKETVTLMGNKERAELVVGQPYSYKVDASLPEEFRNAAVFRRKIELDKKVYNTFTNTQKKEIQRWLTITPGTPTLKVNHDIKEN